MRRSRGRISIAPDHRAHRGFEPHSVLEAIVTPLGRLLRGKRAGDQHSARTPPQPEATHTIEVSTPKFPNGGARPRPIFTGRGPASMVANLQNDFRRAGVASRHIHREYFDLR